MTPPPTTLLLVEPDAADAEAILTALAGTGRDRFQIAWVATLADALERLRAETFEVILLNLMLPDGHGIGTLDRIHQAMPNAMILILCDAAGEGIARRAVRRGAQDYFTKGHIDAHWLPRSLRYIIERGAIQKALRDSEARFRAISDASPLGIFVSDREGGCVYTNTAYQKISGLTFEQTLGTNWSMTIHPDDRERVLAEWRAAARDLTPFQAEYRFRRADGAVVWTRVHSAGMHDGKTRLGLVWTVEDISERKTTESRLRAAEEALFAEKERAQVTLNSIGDAVLTTDIESNITYLNLMAETITGWSREEALGRPLEEVFRIVDGATRRPATNPARVAIERNQTVALSADCVLLLRDGSEVAIEDSAAPIHNRDGQVSGAVIVFHDVSQSRAMARKMAHLAQHDFLTGLPNRVLLTERLTQALGLADRHKRQVALLFLDLDNFKHVNDSLGHAIGDQLLQSVATRLEAGVRATDTVCRQGGDEFVILLTEIEAPRDAAHVAETLLSAFATPHVIGGLELHVSLSIGISIWPDDGGSVDSLLRNADTAMFHAKSSGRNNYQFFKSEMNALAVSRLAMENNLRRALKQDEFVLHYQPQIDLVSGRIIGVEALIRWRDPLLGLIQPGQFVTIAEECGLIVPIGRWVLREACRQVQAWLDAGLPAVPVAVNISALEFRHRDFLAGVARILEETGLAARYLELELTESILMRDTQNLGTDLASLRAMGIRLALDDFGTGYSSLSYLKRFPIDTLKIDQSFLHEILGDPDNGAIVSAVIEMGRSLKRRVIAEGVETEIQLAFLLARQCDEGQGFHFSQPLPAEDFARLLLATADAAPPPHAAADRHLPIHHRAADRPLPPAGPF